MAFKLTKADEDALKDVQIMVDGVDKQVFLNSNTLMFPPIITKDTKSSEWMEFKAGAFEPFKYYVQSKPRAISLEFQWVTGGKFTPKFIHDTTSDIRSYFYGAYFGSDKKSYPAVTINRFYELIPEGITTTWRMMGANIKRSKEMVKIVDAWYPLHVTLSMDLESATKLGGAKSNAAQSDGETPVQFGNLEDTVSKEWY